MRGRRARLANGRGADAQVWRGGHGHPAVGAAEPGPPDGPAARRPADRALRAWPPGIPRGRRTDRPRHRPPAPGRPRQLSRGAAGPGAQRRPAARGCHLQHQPGRAHPHLLHRLRGAVRILDGGPVVHPGRPGPAHAPPRPPAARRVRRLFWHRFGAALGCLLAFLGVGFTLLATTVHYSAGNALYLTFLDAAGAAVSNPPLSTPEKVAQFLLPFDGMAFLPLVTAAVVRARLTGPIRPRHRPIRD